MGDQVLLIPRTRELDVNPRSPSIGTTIAKVLELAQQAHRLVDALDGEHLEPRDLALGRI